MDRETDQPRDSNVPAPAADKPMNFAPGEVVGLGITPSAQPAPLQAAPRQQTVQFTMPAPNPAPAVDTPSEPSAPVSPYVLDPGETGQDQKQQEAPGELSWTAAEFIAHKKSQKWFLVLAGITVVLMILAFLVSRRFFPPIIILFCAFLFGYMAVREPRELPYVLTDTGIGVGQKFYPYTDFNSFAIVDDEAFPSIDFTPMKRFAPTLSVHYDPAQISPIVEYLSEHLPVAPHSRTWIDNLMSRIRF